MSVRRALPGDEAIVRGLRLQALEDSPEDFNSDLETERSWSMSEWGKWIAEGATFVFERPDGARGIAAGVWHRDKPGKVLLISMWVHPDARGTGAADALIGAVLAWARAEGATEVLLHVVKRNARARRCYERNGFQPTSIELVRERGGVVEIEMGHPLDRQAARAGE